jgi:hypothetical protein
MFNRVKYVAITMVLILSSVIFLPETVAADPEVCGVTSSPDFVGTNSDVNYQFNFTNIDPSLNIDWIIISTPTSSFNIVSTSADGWNSYVDSSGAEFNNGNLNPGGSLTLNVEVQTGPFQSGSMDWGIYAFTGSDSNGPGSMVCQNSTQTDMIDNTPYISNLAPSNVTSSSVTINWTTSLPATSQVDYGLDDTYGSLTSKDTNLVTNHSVNLTGLKSNSGYHYEVESTTPLGGDALSGDNTFLTALAQQNTSTNTQTGTQNVAVPTGSSVNKTPPKISLDSIQIPKVVKAIPTVQGTTTDNVGIAKIEYSTDGGQNWLLVNSAFSQGSKSVNFSFTPANLDDGTYHIEARSYDSSGNMATTQPFTLVLDRIPPQIGGSIITVGPQILQPNNDGVIEALTGVDQKITVHSIGGPTSVKIIGQKIGNANADSNFQLTQDPVSGLWSGILSFTKPGAYQLTVHSINGAGETTNQYLQTIDVLAPAQVISSKTNNVIKGATAILYYKNVDTGGWVTWDGTAYNETNPQVLSKGEMHYLIPSGTYYLKITASGFKPLLSKIFTVNQSLPLTTAFKLSASSTLNLGLFHLAIPNLSASSVNISSNLTLTKFIPSSLIGRQFPNFSLASTNGTTETELNLFGKSSVVIALSTWSPTTIEQLKLISELQTNTSINVVPIFVQDSLADTRIYLSTNGYPLTALADPKGTLVIPLQVGYLPTYYFVNQSGYIKKVMVGVLSKNEIQSALVEQ